MKSQFREKNPILPMEKFPYFVQPRNAMLHVQHFIIQFFLLSLSSGRLHRSVKNKRTDFKLLALKVDAVTYERWSLTRGSKYSDLTWERLLNWFGRWGGTEEGGRLLEVVATGSSTVLWQKAFLFANYACTCLLKTGIFQRVKKRINRSWLMQFE